MVQKDQIQKRVREKKNLFVTRQKMEPLTEELKRKELRGGGILFLLFTFSLLIAGCSENPGRVVATVGESQITQEDIMTRKRVEEAYVNDSLTELQVLAGMIGETLEKEVARKLHLIPTAEQIATVDSTTTLSTREPELLTKIRKVFGEDTAAFRQIFILPKMISSNLQTYARTAPMPAGAGKEKINKAYALIKGGTVPLQEAANSLELIYTVDTISMRDTARKGQEMVARYGSAKISDPVLPLTDSMKIGQIFPQVLEDNAVYRVFRLIGRSDAGPIIESIQSPKRSYLDWLRKEGSDITIDVNDEATRKELRERYPSVWWINNPGIGGA